MVAVAVVQSVLREVLAWISWNESGAPVLAENVHVAGMEGKEDTCQAFHQAGHIEAYRKEEDSSHRWRNHRASWRSCRSGLAGAWNCGDLLVGRGHQNSRWVLRRQHGVKQKGWDLHPLAQMDSDCSHTDRAAQMAPTDRVRAVEHLVPQVHPVERDCSEGQISYWAHSHWGELAEERGPTGREDGVEKAPPLEGHRGSRRGCPDFRNGWIEASDVAASDRDRGPARAYCGTCGEAVRGQACDVRTCGASLGVGEREVRVQRRRDASLVLLGGRLSPRGRSRQLPRCSPSLPRPLLPKWCTPPGCQTRPVRPRSLLLRRCSGSGAPHLSSC